MECFSGCSNSALTRSVSAPLMLRTRDRKLFVVTLCGTHLSCALLESRIRADFGGWSDFFSAP